MSRHTVTTRDIFKARLADAQANRNRKVRCERFHSRVDGRLLHSIRVDDRRRNFKEHLGYFTEEHCPLCNPGAEFLTLDDVTARERDAVEVEA